MWSERKKNINQKQKPKLIRHQLAVVWEWRQTYCHADERDKTIERSKRKQKKNGETAMHCELEKQYTLYSKRRMRKRRRYSAMGKAMVQMLLYYCLFSSAQQVIFDVLVRANTIRLLVEKYSPIEQQLFMPQSKYIFIESHWTTNLMSIEFVQIYNDQIELPGFWSM